MSAFGRDPTIGLQSRATAKELERASWLPMLAGIWALLAGILAIVWPGGTVLALAIILGVYLLVAGTTRLAHALQWRGGGHGRLLLAVHGVLDVILGILTLVWPGITVTVLALIVGIDLLFFGGFALAAAFDERHAGGGPGWYLAAGISSLVVGIVTIVWPGITVYALAMLLGIVLVWLGVVLVLGAMRLRHAVHHPLGATTWTA
jgi:uncharacterized membrane protein HdeD (DUF308 family)